MTAANSTAALAPRSVPEPGLCYGIPFEDYLRWQPCTNQSTLKNCRDGLLYYKASRDDDDDLSQRWHDWVENGVPHVDDLLIGQALHCWHLEPHAVIDRLAVWDRLNEKGKPADRSGGDWQKFHREHTDAGRIVLTTKQYECVRGMLEGIGRSRAVHALPAGCSEVSGVFDWDVDGQVTRCKFRCDVITEGQDRTIIDLKKVNTRAFSRIANHFAEFGYYHQAAFYVEGVERLTGYRPRYVIIAAREKPPHDVHVCDIHPDDIAAAREDIEHWLVDVGDAERSGWWPGTDRDEIITPRMPAWAKPDKPVELVVGGKPVSL